MILNDFIAVYVCRHYDIKLLNEIFHKNAKQTVVTKHFFILKQRFLATFGYKSSKESRVIFNQQIK